MRKFEPKHGIRRRVDITDWAACAGPMPGCVLRWRITLDTPRQIQTIVSSWLSKFGLSSKTTYLSATERPIRSAFKTCLPLSRQYTATDSIPRRTLSMVHADSTWSRSKPSELIFHIEVRYSTKSRTCIPSMRLFAHRAMRKPGLTGEIGYTCGFGGIDVASPAIRERHRRCYLCRPIQATDTVRFTYRERGNGSSSDFGGTTVTGRMYWGGCTVLLVLRNGTTMLSFRAFARGDSGTPDTSIASFRTMPHTRVGNDLPVIQTAATA